ncbi:MAG: dihydroneopterin aldolase [Legionella sp. 40-6]|nr:dihydroneopterin aldolase [Legionella sp.]OJY57148.1 MAG: dihydroneopterin aldolase [Legionella sp. 40-6]
MDTISIKGLKIATRIGVHEWEQRIDQTLLIDLSLGLDLSNCAEDIVKTVDYAILSQVITEYVSQKSFKLIETVANEVAQLIRAQTTASHVSVTVSKPQAIKNATLVQVTVHR